MKISKESVRRRRTNGDVVSRVLKRGNDGSRDARRSSEARQINLRWAARWKKKEKISKAERVERRKRTRRAEENEAFGREEIVERRARLGRRGKSRGREVKRKGKRERGDAKLRMRLRNAASRGEVGTRREKGERGKTETRRLTRDATAARRVVIERDFARRTVGGAYRSAELAGDRIVVRGRFAKNRPRRVGGGVERSGANFDRLDGACSTGAD